MLKYMYVYKYLWKLQINTQVKELCTCLYISIYENYNFNAQV